MSTEDQNRCVVTLEKGIDVDRFLEEMTDSYGSETVPTRQVQLWNEKPDSKRNFDFVMTADEAAQLRKDPRVLDVRYGSKKENGFVLTKAILEESKTYSKTLTLDNTHFNWGFASCTQSDPFTPASQSGTSSAPDLSYQYPYTLTGNGVDIVIQDSGIDPNHPEWLNRAGTSSRLQQIDWPAEAGLSGLYTQNANHYTDPDGHGTHVAGTAAGRLYGWAKDAEIYAITIIDNAASFGVSTSFNLIRNWHNNKSNSRPTVVNMSWEYFSTYVNITGGNWRGTPWTATTMQAQYGMVQQNLSGGNYTFPIRVTSVDADIQDCIDDGIILVGASGNDSHKSDVPGGSDYDNYFVNTFGNRYYHRGATPAHTSNVICVGNISYVYVDGEEPKFNSSTCGPRVDIHAPGGGIQSAIPVGSNIASSTGTSDYPLDSNYKITKISGTSMSSPQVAGCVAGWLEARPALAQADVKNLIDRYAEENRIHDPSTGTPSTDYQNFRALQGSPNRYLKTPFVSPNPKQVNGGLSIS